MEVFHQDFLKDPRVALLGVPPKGIDGRAEKVPFTNPSDISGCIHHYYVVKT